MILMDGDREIEISNDNFHKFFYLGFCITIHASQGATIKVPYTIYDWNHQCMCKRGKYVSLSRGTEINNIQIVGGA
jgi:hypothetical protein